MDALNLSDRWHKSWDTVEYIDDFVSLDTTVWLTLVSDGGSVAEDADGLNGIIAITGGDGGNEDEAYLFTNEVGKFLDGKPISIGGRFQYAEGATNAANIGFGIGEGFGGANTLQDAGAGPPADYDGAMFYKVDGGSRWIFETSVGTTQLTTELDYTAGGSGFICVQMDLIPLSSSEYSVSLWIDPEGGKNLNQARAYNANYQSMALLPPVKHRFPYSSVGEMAAGFFVKNGSTTNEVMNVDLFKYAAKR